METGGVCIVGGIACGADAGAGSVVVSGSLFFASRGRGAAGGVAVGVEGVSVVSGFEDGSSAFVESSSDFFVGIWAGVFVSAFSGSGSGVSRFSMRTLPVWLSVRTGSASAINCSIFFRGEAGRAGEICIVFWSAPEGEASLVGGRSTTPWVAGSVRIPVVPASILGVAAGVVAGVATGGLAVGAAMGGSSAAGVGLIATGTGLTAGGCGSPGAGWALSGADLKGGGSSGSGRGFLAGKKILGQCMSSKSCAQFQGRGWYGAGAIFNQSSGCALFLGATPL